MKTPTSLSSHWINRNLTGQLKKKSRLFTGKHNQAARLFSKEVKRNIRKAEWNHVNNVIKEILNKITPNHFLVIVNLKDMITFE